MRQWRSARCGGVGFAWFAVDLVFEPVSPHAVPSAEPGSIWGPITGGDPVGVASVPAEVILPRERRRLSALALLAVEDELLLLTDAFVYPANS